MKRRDFIRSGIGAAVAGTMVAQAGAAAPGNAQDRPNVLYIIMHDLGDALGCYGVHNVRSPRLDQFAAEGVRFAHYYCASTPCSPSRGCIMTGRYAHSNGLIGLANRNWSLPATEKTMVDYFNEAGYHTVNFGGQHERIGTNAYQYAETLGKPGQRTADQLADVVCAWLKQWDPARGPFLMNCYSQDVHAPWDRPEFQGKYDPDQVKPPAFLPNIKSIRQGLAQFYGSVEVMDAAMGRVFDTLRETGLAGRTIVIFTTDHGVGFPRAKSTLYDPGLSTALMVRWPGRIKAGVVCEHLLSNVDLLPTMMEMIGRQPAPEIQGRSFAPAILGGQYTPNEQIFAERNYHDDYDPIRGVRTAKYKYIRNFAARNRYKMPHEATDEDNGMTLRNAGQERPFEELYDLEKDPLEFRNVAEAPEYAEALNDMRGRLVKWMRETNDYMRGAQDTVVWPVSDTRTGGPAMPNQRPKAGARGEGRGASKKKR